MGPRKNGKFWTQLAHVHSLFALALLWQMSLPPGAAAHKPSTLWRGDVSANIPADRPPPALRRSAAAAGFTVDVWIWLRPANVALLSNWKNTFPHNAVCLHPSIPTSSQPSSALLKAKPTFLLIHPPPSTWRPYQTVNSDLGLNDQTLVSILCEYFETHHWQPI